MACLLRLICLLLFVMVSPSSQAAIPVTVKYCLVENIKCGTSAEIVAYLQASSPVRGCGGGVERPATWYSRNETSSSVDFWYSSEGCPGYGPYDAYQLSAGAVGSGCPANSTASGSSCSCNSGFEEKNSQCVKPDDRSKQKACGADFTYAGWGVGIGKYTEPWAINGVVPSGEQCDAYTDANPGGTGCKVYFSATGTTKNDNGTTTTTGNFRPVAGTNAGEGVPCSPTYEGEGKDVVDSKPPEKCDGYEGTVGGEKRCIPNVQNNGVDWAKTEKTEKKDRKSVV